MAIIESISETHRPIFLFLKYHLRRPGEACALKWEDWDGSVFIIRRGVSARRIVDSTKTGAIHFIPCHNDFLPVLKGVQRTLFSPYIFINPLARTRHKNYTLESLNRIWKEACNKVGESISLYAGLKHSTACQLVNDYGLSLSDLQTAGDWARPDSVKRYAVVEVARKKELLEGKVIKLQRRSQDVHSGETGGPQATETK
jgi:integrase